MRGGVGYKKFKIVDVFEVVNTHSILKENVVFDSGKYPYVTASEGNNSIVSYIAADTSILERGNCIVIGGKTMVITYQESDYVSNDSHNLALYLKNPTHGTKLAYLYFVSTLYAALACKYHWGDSISKKKIQDDVIQLPVTPSGEPDYEFMEIYMRATEKLAIKDAILLKDRITEETKKIVV